MQRVKKPTKLRGGKVRTVTCGSCHATMPAGVAHNARTCKKKTTNQHGVNVMKNVPPVKKTVEGARGASSLAKLNSRNVMKHWEEYIRREGLSQDGTAERYTFEELQTLWLLVLEKTGKQGKVLKENEKLWTDSDTETLNSFIKNADGEGAGVSPQDWFKFFKTLGVAAKVSYLRMHATKTKTQHKFFHSIPLELADRHVVRDVDGERLNVPLNTLPAFLKDPSPYVRTVFAEVPHLPQAAVDLLINDKRLDVVLALANNPTTSAESLEKIEQRLVDLSERNPIWKEKRYVTAIRVSISGHHNTPNSLLMKYLEGGISTAEPEMSRCIFGNPNLQERSVVRYRENLRKKEREAIRKLEEVKNAQPVQVKENLEAEWALRKVRNDYREVVKYGWGTEEDACRLIEENMEEYRKRSAAAENLIARTISASNLTPELVQKYYQEVKSEPFSYDIAAAFLLNPHTSYEIVKDIRERFEYTIEQGGKTFYSGYLAAYFNRI